jgi:hypothetical protein
MLAHVVRATLFAAAWTIATVAAAQQGSIFAERVRDKCTSDAMRHCSEHALGSTEMRYCMEAKFRLLSRDCVIALEDEGLIPRTARKTQALR